MTTTQEFSSEEIAQVCEDAADYIRVHGWCQNRLETPEGQVCLAGALEGALGILHTADRLAFDVPERTRREDLTADALIEVAHHHLNPAAGPGHAIHWNDRKGRTADEVIDALVHTAKGLRA